MRMRRLSIGLAIAAAVPLTLLAGWQRAIEPALVKIPGGIERVNHYSGTIAVYVDPATGSSLTVPQVSPMTINRVTKSVPDSTGATTTALQETDTVTLLGHRSDQTSVFAVDRTSARNVFDSRAVAFGSNVVDRKGSYFPNLPFGVDNKRTYPIWNNEAGAPYVMHRADGPATTTVHGLEVLRMTGTLAAAPVASYYPAELEKLGSPLRLTAAQLQAQIEATGVKASDVLDGLAKVLTPEEMTTIIGTLGNDLPLEYSTSLTGDALVEQSTGIVVSTHSVKTFFVTPAPSSIKPVKAILDKHSDDAFVKIVDDNLTALVGTPRRAFTLDYRTDPASVASMASYADSQRSKVRLAKLVLPAGLLLLSAGLAVGAWFAHRKAREGEQAHDFVDIRDSPEREDTREREPAGV
jgi:hypothetical protein